MEKAFERVLFELSDEEICAIKSKIASRIRRVNDCLYWFDDDRDEYGYIYIRGYSFRVHRIILSWKLGRQLSLLVLHTCDIKQCVNENHLYEGDHAENALDYWESKRKNKNVILNRSGPKKSVWPVGYTKGRMLTYNGVSRSLAEWAKMTGIDKRTIRSRLYLGWSVERTLETKVEPRKCWDDGYFLRHRSPSI